MSFLDSLPDYGAAAPQGPQPPQQQGSGSFYDALPDYQGGASWSATPPPPTRLEHLGLSLGDIPNKIDQAATSGASAVVNALSPNSEENRASIEAQKAAPWYDITAGADRLLNVPKAALGALETASAPFTGAARSVIGHLFDASSPLSQEDKSKLVDIGLPQQPTGDQVADKAMMGMRPRGTFGKEMPTAGYVPGPYEMPAIKPSVNYGPQNLGPPPAPPTPNGPLGVNLSEGQLTGKLPLIQQEQKALRGQGGPDVQAQAQQFADQQAQELAAARETIAKGLDQSGQVIASTPQEAGGTVSASVRGGAAVSKAMTDAAYQTARQIPGEIHAGAFEGMPQQIKGDLTLSQNPVIIDQATTPNASKMIDYLDQRVGQLSIPNKADPFGPPSAQNVVGVNLSGVDQWRKALSGMRGDAYASGNAADARATRAVLNAFDTRINDAMNGGLFNGDPRAIDAWNAARSAHADYRQTYGGGANNMAGQAIEKIIGKGANPGATPNDVADMLFGASGTNPGTRNLAIANRVKSIMGEQSPQWSGVKQGLFSRLVETPPGVTDFGPGRVATRLNEFLNGSGKEMASAVFRPDERALLQQYADLTRTLEIPQAGANWSNTATFTGRALSKLGHLSELLGAAIGATLGAHSGLPEFMGEAVGASIGAGAGKAVKSVGNVVAVRKIAKQMPLVSAAVAQYQKQLAHYQRTGSAASASVAAGTLARALDPLGIKLDNQQ